MSEQEQPAQTDEVPQEGGGGGADVNIDTGGGDANVTQEPAQPVEQPQPAETPGTADTPAGGEQEGGEAAPGV